MGEPQANKSNFLKKLQAKWQLKSLWQVVLVLVVFACTGFTILLIKQPIFDFLGFDTSERSFLKTVIYLLLVLPLYQLFLLIYGFIFGQFAFFWEKEKQFFRRLRRLLTQNKK
ncbi:DUF6787 family protein [Cyclobacterium marinum]|uniref:DUF6787 domain-containing protein n=1 Tax=Cyclobacterium marinum (strain ATCC 25205 / DSM 745 / LMG 13164 / NCIMB 1802) TaxID=880070 RepID=G0IWY0_CYCMS|nr:DUF6787 family protein [Cyclobacterium marinum]AEL24898.1 conserved hypothetical protein, membrane [Cyclobacterium marinum DSM 745]|tara:strand:+ start:78739 stop:79077 length:339 start_codon:yes stop_codon:yes gene_type:complete